MRLILFVGLQGSGKSTFYFHQFARSHLRLSMDMLRTRHREHILLNACLLAKQPTVIDNTNPTREQRAAYIAKAKAHGFEIVGYYFESRIEACKQRNSQRPAKQVVPLAGLLGTYKRLVPPSLDEGFDRLHYVRITSPGEFLIEEWKGSTDEV